MAKHTTITKHTSPSTKVEYYVIQTPKGYHVNALTPEGSKPVVSMKPQSNRKAAILHAKVMAYGPSHPVTAKYAAKMDGSPKRTPRKSKTARKSKTTTKRAPRAARRSAKPKTTPRKRDARGRFVKVSR